MVIGIGISRLGSGPCRMVSFPGVPIDLAHLAIRKLVGVRRNAAAALPLRCVKHRP